MIEVEIDLLIAEVRVVENQDGIPLSKIAIEVVDLMKIVTDRGKIKIKTKDKTIETTIEKTVLEM